MLIERNQYAHQVGVAWRPVTPAIVMLARQSMLNDHWERLVILKKRMLFHEGLARVRVKIVKMWKLMMKSTCPVMLKQAPLPHPHDYHCCFVLLNISLAFQMFHIR